MSEYRLKLEIVGDSAQAREALKSAAESAKSASQSIETASKSAAETYTATSRTMATEASSTGSAIKRSATEIAASISRAGASARNDAAQVQNSLSGMGSSFRSNFLVVGAAAMGVTSLLRLLKDQLTEIITVNQKFQAQGSAYKAITGSSGGSASEMGFVAGEAKRLGLELMSTYDGYKKILAASRETVLQGKPTRDIFLGIAEASSALNISAEDTNGILLAVAQMMSKGTVQSEELKGQLGERLPGAFNLAAKAMGMTTAELQKNLESGKILAEDLLPKLAKVLHEQYGGSVADSANSSAKAVTRLTNELAILRNNLAENTGLSAYFARMVNDITTLTEVMNEAGPRARTFGSIIRDNLSLSMLGGGYLGQAAMIKALIDAGTEASRKHRDLSGQESFAGIGGGLEGPRSAPWTPPAPDRETLEAQEAYNNDLGIAETRTKVWKAAHEAAQSAVKSSGTALEQYNAKLKEYDEMAAKGASASDVAVLKRKASEEYQKALEREAKAAETASRKESTEAQRAAREAHDYKVALIRHEMDIVGISGEQRISIARRVAEEEARFHGANSDEAVRAQRLIAQAEKARDEETARIREIEIGAIASAEKSKLEIRKGAVETDYALGRITADQRIQMLSALTQAEIEIERQAALQRQGLRQQDPVEQARINAELGELDQKRQVQLKQSINQLAVEQHNRWKQMADGISSAWSGAIKNMLFSTQSWKESLRNVLQTIGGSLIDGLIKRMVNSWLLGEATKTEATAAGEGERQAITTAGMSQGLLTQAASGIKTVMNNAYKAASGAYAATVEIPIVGPILAPAAAAAAFVAVAAFGGGIASAAGGWELPADQLMYGHRKEVVLPVHWTERLTAVANLAVAGAAERSGGGGVTNFNVSAMDSRDVARVLRRHGGKFNDATRRAVRNFALRPGHLK